MGSAIYDIRHPDCTGYIGQRMQLSINYILNHDYQNGFDHFFN